MRIFGLILVVFSTVFPIVWFVTNPEMSNDALAVMSQYVGSVALILMGWSQLIATRLKGLQTVFGAQDRIYILHKWLGICAMAAVLIHDTVDAELRGARETFLVDLGETLGEISLYGLLILVTITLITFVPYRLWRWTHRFMGAFFAMSAIHFFLIPRPFELTDAAGLYISAFCILGILSYLYTLLPFVLKPGIKSYRVDDVSENGGATVLKLSPRDRGIKHKAGQFAFIRIDAGSRKEIHPFTISSGPTPDQRLQFTIRPLGSYTSLLRRLSLKDATVSIDGPYGHFTLQKSGRPSVWIAAGVGITPFLAWAQALSPEHGSVDLFYCYRSETDAPHLEELQRLAKDKQNLKLHPIASSEGKRLTVEHLQDTCTTNLRDMDFAFCGPVAMRKELQRGLTAIGVSDRRFRYEEFEIRTGISFRKLVGFLLGTFNAAQRVRP